MVVRNTLLVLIPTYNERENIGRFLEHFRTSGVSAHLLFVDDNSPDGPGDILDRIVEQNSYIYVIHRPAKLGVGSAHVRGLRWAYENNYQLLITMDCDGTHLAKDIKRFVEKSVSSDVVVGSRFLSQYSLIGWNYKRVFLTKLGHYLTRKLLKLNYDATGAFRLYKISNIPIEIFDLVSSTSYSFFFESLFILSTNQYRISEIQIDLPARTYGHSKMEWNDISHSLILLCTISMRSFFSPQKYIVTKPLISTSHKVLVDRQGWDSYWANHKPRSRFLYDVVAVFYRRYIIKNNLNYFVNKYFPQNSKVLHAGCGSGQVDTDVCDTVKLTALDLSTNALSLYNRENGHKAKLIHADILDTGLEDKEFSGIYNLGVMEHFTETEIHQILTEFRRILSDDGKLVLFW